MTIHLFKYRKDAENYKDILTKGTSIKGKIIKVRVSDYFSLVTNGPRVKGAEKELTYFPQQDDILYTVVFRKPYHKKYDESWLKEVGLKRIK